ncbi:PREDICTED: uncharacterized protein LOC101311778 [Fragaria vesca subsp. vesca]|uniref:uncharacterized protein LOC101311778 n=1 Tax=Fragaria vesca subsp. vesca TaxID=101020 RepID=UPI0002C2DDCA|nr:PREDICTED: uncharacterized protein LOC101311778 [Fragaria vesca subsp. vesca]
MSHRTMALSLTAASLHLNPSFSSSSSFLNPKHKPPPKLYPYPSSFRTPSAQSEGAESWIKEEDPSASSSGSSSSAQTRLDLLEQLTSTSSSVDGGYESDASSRKLTIREQLAQLVGDRDGDFTIPLGKKFRRVSPKVLTVSQKRNIRRQAYLNEVSQRNDSTFFATIGAFVLVPPLVILGIAIATGYVQLSFLN